MKDWIEKYRPMRQRTVRAETAKDKSGTLPQLFTHSPNSNNVWKGLFYCKHNESVNSMAAKYFFG